MAPRAALFCLVLVSASIAQPTLEVDLNTGATAQWSSAAGPHLLVKTRARFNATERDWAHLLIGALCTDNQISVPSWVRPRPSVDPATVSVPALQSTWNGPSTPLLDVASDVFGNMFTCALETYFATGASPTACQDWAVPMLSDGQSGLNTVQRIWDARPDVWRNSAVGTELGLFHSSVWDGTLVDFASGDITDTNAMSAESLFRLACIYQSIQAGQGLQGANDFFDSAAYATTMMTGKLEVRLQGFTATSASPSVGPPGTEDVNAPPLVGHPIWQPSTKMTNYIGITVLVPLPDSVIVLPEFEETVTPGANVHFSMTLAPPPVTLVFPTTTPPNYETTVVCHNASHEQNPIRYTCTVPLDVDLSQIPEPNGNVPPTPFTLGGIGTQEEITAR